MTSKYFELKALRQGYTKIAGVDEVGCGCLCGPVVAAAVILDFNATIKGINDSKKLRPKKRYLLSKEITTRAIGWAIGMASAEEIDRINIRRASFSAMQRALANLQPQPDYVLIDGFSIPGLTIPHRGIKKGDSRSISIGAASIIAKVIRDDLMIAYHTLHPQYNLKKNKGYPTQEHREALTLCGASPLHRMSYRLFS